MRELRAISSRADITAKSFTNTYDFGSFSGYPRKMMEAYYDAHVYVSNLGTVVFMLRLPRTVLPDDVLNQYAIEYGLNWWTTVNKLAEDTKTSSYDKLYILLVDMRDAYSHADRRPEFDKEFARILEQNTRRPALMRRLKEVQLPSHFDLD